LAQQGQKIETTEPIRSSKEFDIKAKFCSFKDTLKLPLWNYVLPDFLNFMGKISLKLVRRAGAGIS
jgi:hypothetical protein